MISFNPLRLLDLIRECFGREPIEVRSPPRAIPPPFVGWDTIHNGTASIGQIGNALRDLDKRLSKLEGKE